MSGTLVKNTLGVLHITGPVDVADLLSEPNDAVCFDGIHLVSGTYACIVYTDELGSNKKLGLYLDGKIPEEMTVLIEGAVQSVSGRVGVFLSPKRKFSNEEGSAFLQKHSDGQAYIEYGFGFWADMPNGTHGVFVHRDENGRIDALEIVVLSDRQKETKTPYVKVGEYAPATAEHEAVIHREFYRQGCIVKDEDAFLHHPDKVCYVPENSDAAYTRNDFLSLCNGQEEFAQQLFDSVNWQHPETLFDEWFREDEWGWCDNCQKIYNMEGVACCCPECGNASPEFPDMRR